MGSGPITANRRFSAAGAGWGLRVVRRSFGANLRPLLLPREAGRRSCSIRTNLPSPFPMLKDTIDAAIKQAMLARDKVRLTTLRSIKAQIMLAETADGAAAAGITPKRS